MREPKARSRARLTDGGFTVLHFNHEPINIRWNDVWEVITFKEDLFAYDLICLAFRIGDDLWITIDEETDGWNEITQTAETHFAFEPTDWYSKVMIPAFKTNKMCLYFRQKPKTSPSP